MYVQKNWLHGKHGKSYVNNLIGYNEIRSHSIWSSESYTHLHSQTSDVHCALRYKQQQQVEGQNLTCKRPASSLNDRQAQMGL